MEARKPEVVRRLFEFIGLPDFWPDFSGQALKAKRPRCHLCASPASFVRCDGVPVGVGVLAGARHRREANSRSGDFHDARAALTAAPTPKPVFGNGTAATRRHARHPEGTLFLGFLLALLVLVAVLGAPCRRSLGDAVLLPDEEDM